MQKKMVWKQIALFFLLLFFDGTAAGWLKAETSLDSFREAGIPTELFQEAKAGREELELYQTFWEDLEYFPLAGDGRGENRFSFEDGWHEKRTYGGERLHEGCDIFGEQAVSGYYPVVSMTDGVVEQVGWLPLGGWRIGIRSRGGGYFYYAHLSSYGRSFLEGEKVQAGEVLGFLGDSGYGEEGTTGKFPPHLHLGIYVKTWESEEYALNPYPVLEFLKEKQKCLRYSSW